MSSFVRYFCYYCASRLIFGALRGHRHAHKATAPETPCQHHGRGIAITFIVLFYGGLILFPLLGLLIK